LQPRHAPELISVKAPWRDLAKMQAGSSKGADHAGWRHAFSNRLCRRVRSVRTGAGMGRPADPPSGALTQPTLPLAATVEGIARRPTIVGGKLAQLIEILDLDIRRVNMHADRLELGEGTRRRAAMRESLRQRRHPRVNHS